MYVKIKMSHSIQMLNIQIDTKSLKICRFNNIKLSFFASQTKGNFALFMFIRYGGKIGLEIVL